MILFFEEGYEWVARVCHECLWCEIEGLRQTLAENGGHSNISTDS